MGVGKDGGGGSQLDVVRVATHVQLVGRLVSRSVSVPYNCQISEALVMKHRLSLACGG